MNKKILNNNFETNYSINDWITFDYIVKSIKNIRKDKDGYNEYLLSDGQWVTGKFIAINSD